MKDLLVEYLPRVYRFALRLAHEHHEAEEIVQETFVRAWRRRDSLRDPSAARVWLFRIAANVWRDRLRRAQRGGEQTVALTTDMADPSPRPDGGSEEDEVRRMLRLMEALPARQRQVLYLSAFEDMDHATIARALEISPEAVKASLSLARKTMRKWIGESGRTR